MTDPDNNNPEDNSRYVQTDQDVVQQESLKYAVDSASACRELIASGHRPPSDVTNAGACFVAAVQKWISDGM